MYKYFYQNGAIQGGSVKKKELYQKIDDFVQTETLCINFGVCCFVAFFVAGTQVLQLLSIDIPILFNMQKSGIALLVSLLISLVKPSFAPVASILTSLIIVKSMMFTVSDLTFKHQYSFFTGYLIACGLKIFMNSLGKYRDIGILGAGLLFSYFSYKEEDLILLSFFTVALTFFCAIGTVDLWHQRKLVEDTNTFAIYAENELKTKKLMEKLFHKPSFMITSQLNTLYFCSSTYSNNFTIDWNDLLMTTTIAQLEEIDKYMKAQNILSNPLTLRQYIDQQQNHIAESKTPILLIGFVPVEHITNANSQACRLFEQHNLVPFQIKITSISTDGEFNYFIEYDAKAVDEILAARALERYKENIMSSISHDVKTPISTSLNHCSQTRPYKKLEILKSAIRDVDQQIHKAHFNLSLMMLNAKAIKDEDASTPNISCFGAHRLMRSLCKVLNIEALGKNICLNICSDERFTIFNDKEAFLYVNYILISNAITHTCDGCVNVILTPILPRHNDGVRLVEVTIEDEGTGMEPSVAKQIEENNFFQIGSNKSFQGGFLGLSNAIKLLKKISPPTSRLRVQSINGKGTKFSYQVYHRHPAGKYHEKNQRDDIAPEDPSDDDAPTTNLFELSHVKENFIYPKIELCETGVETIQNSQTDPEKKKGIEKDSLSPILSDADKNDAPLGNNENNSNPCQKYNDSISEKTQCTSENKSIQPIFLYKIVDPIYLNGFEDKLSKINITKEEYESLHIIIVDDCFFSLQSLYSMLQTVGLKKIFKTVSSPAALEYLQSNTGKVNMIFTDYQMPKMDGYQLLCKAKELNILQDSCKNVLLSAACELKLENFTEKVFHSFIKKPFRLQQVFHEVLDYLIQMEIAKKKIADKL